MIRLTIFRGTRLYSKDSRLNLLTLLALSLLLCSFFSPGGTLAADTAFYSQATIESSINPVTAGYLKRSIEQAEDDGAIGLILQLDTPGGLMESMNEMTDAILNAGVPVIVWIGPSGARAASAGVFITYASHIAAMAEGTRIGAAHPVSGGGQSMDETMKKKVTNDAVAQIKSMARQRGRNEVLADSFVRESVSLIADDALRENVVEHKVNSIVDLIDQLQGQTVKLSGNQTVRLEDAPVREIAMSSKENFLKILVSPNLVYILMMLGFYGLIYEFAEPGLGLGAVVGGICLLLALYGMSVLPVNYAGLGLVGLGLALMVLDIFVPTFGILTMGGMTSFALGSVFLFRTPAFSVSLGLIVGVTAATVTAVVIAGYLILGAFNLPVAIGDDSIIGRTGTVKEELNPEGMVYVWGEYWQAQSDDGSSIERDKKIEVTEKHDRELTVKLHGKSEEQNVS